jgi:hypothetical protein
MLIKRTCQQSCLFGIKLNYSNIFWLEVCRHLQDISTNYIGLRKDNNKRYYINKGRDSSVGTGWTVRGSNPCGGERFSTRPDWPWAHPASYTIDTGSFLGVKRPGRGVDHPPPSSVEVKERVELYIYSPSGPS